MRISRVATHLVLISICALWLIPVAAALATSFRTPSAATESGWWNIVTDAKVGFGSFSSAFHTEKMGSGFLNSALISIPSSVFVVALSAIAAYAFATIEFRGREFLYVLFCLMLLTPHQIALEPMLALFIHLGMNGQFASVWAFQTGFELPLGVLVLRSTFAALPHSVLEAARIDGASAPQIFRRIALPLSIPGLLSVFILQFVSAWNDLLDPLVFLGGDKAPVTVTVAGLTSAQAVNTTDVAAAVVLAIIPPIIVFAALQRYFVGGLTQGATKG